MQSWPLNFICASFPMILTLSLCSILVRLAILAIFIECGGSGGGKGENQEFFWWGRLGKGKWGEHEYDSSEAERKLMRIRKEVRRTDLRGGKIRETNDAGKIREVLKLDEEMKDLARSLISEQSLLMFGRGYNYATTLEGSLKVKKVALMHGEGILAGEMKHGPLALVDENLPIVVISTRDQCFSRLIVMCTEGDATTVCGGSYRVIEVPLGVDCLQPLVNIIPLQLLAYHLMALRGYNVDQPRNLAKSVTTE
ncbi:glutamine--fructose-6-phosphate aminotransferase [isomerizing] 2 [Tanacetum coccineum]